MVRFINKLIKNLILIIVTVLLIVILINLYVSTIGNKLLSTSYDVKNSDCILVFGASVYGGVVSPTLAKRLDTAYELYALKKAPKIIVSGDHGQKDYNEVKAMYDYLVKKGVMPDDIFMDHAGFETYDSVYRAKEVFLAKKVILVSQKEHLIRGLYIGKKVGLDVLGVPCENYETIELKYQKSREFLARLKAFARCEILKNEPKFLGETMSVFGDGNITRDEEK